MQLGEDTMNELQPSTTIEQSTTPPGKAAGPCALVIFGASGDLTSRKLFPALLNLARDGLLPHDFAVVGLARRPLTDEQFRNSIAEDMRGMKEPPQPAVWSRLAPRVSYLSGDLTQPATYRALSQRLARCDQELHTGGNHLFYLATAPTLFAAAVHQLGEAGLTREENDRWRRVIIEKPFGRDLASARQLNRELRQDLEENQIYRIDHYLGKETVQNIMVFRFANGIFEPLWNRRYIDHVQITVAETVGVEGRGGYFDHAGTLRDMVPNHLFQLVSLIGMEPPALMEADAMRDEQVKLLRAVRPLNPPEVVSNVVRGQYGPGAIDGKQVPGYRSEPNVAADSRTDTFVALKLEVDNWRWADVPFYLRTGKRLAQRHTQIVIQFRRAPHRLFRNTAIASCLSNQLVLNIQPDEGLSLRIGAKVPGPVVRLGLVTMDFDYERAFGDHPSTGYERLLYDCMIGDATLFQRADMVELGWSIVAPIQQAWQAGGDGLQLYPSGSWGPSAAAELMTRDGRRWREEDPCS
jgi:glucose-6-phosphate 1-dehydrogenase